jgi:hypothetical protein
MSYFKKPFLHIYRMYRSAVLALQESFKANALAAAHNVKKAFSKKSLELFSQSEKAIFPSI